MFSSVVALDHLQTSHVRISSPMAQICRNLCHRFPQVSTSVTWNRWKDMKSTESLMRLLGHGIVSCYALLQSQVCVCPEQRGMSVPAPSPDLNSHKPFLHQCLPCLPCLSCAQDVPKMCPGCLVLVSPSCIMLHLKLAY